jgi:hypothetical protein
MPSYIPNSNHKKVAWYRRFLANVKIYNGTPVPPAVGLLGLSESDVTSIASQVGSLDAKWYAAENRNTRSSSDVNAFKAAKINAFKVISTMVEKIQAVPGLDPGIKDALQITLRNKMPTRIPKPVEGPDFSIDGYNEAQILLSYKIKGSPPGSGEGGVSGKAKPVGVQYAVAVVSFPTIPVGMIPENPLTFYLTKSPSWLDVPEACIGKEVAVRGYWATKKGEKSNWSHTETGIIPGSSQVTLHQAPGHPVRNAVISNEVPARMMP